MTIDSAVEVIQMDSTLVCIGFDKIFHTTYYCITLIHSEFFLSFTFYLRNFDNGSWQMLMSTYKVGGWGEKRPKTCLRNI